MQLGASSCIILLFYLMYITKIVGILLHNIIFFAGGEKNIDFCCFTCLCMVDWFNDAWFKSMVDS